MRKPKQTDRVLSWLRTRGELTTREAVTELNIMSLPKSSGRAESLSEQNTGQARTARDTAFTRWQIRRLIK